MSEIECYKVVREIDGRYLSFITSRETGLRKSSKKILRYTLGLATYPKIPNSAIFCFTTLEWAKEFLDSHLMFDNRKHTCAIFQGIGEQRVKGKMVCIYPTVPVSIMKAVWNENGKVSTMYNPAPSGTVFVEWFRPIQKVYTMPFTI